MGFFEDPSVSRLFENHIRKVVGLENTQATVIINNYRRARQELKNRLLLAPDNTFTEARLAEALSQVDAAIRAAEAANRSEIFNSYDFMQDMGIEDSVSEINKFEKKFNGVSQPLPLEAIMASIEPENLLLNQFESSMESYNQGLRSRVQRTMTQSLIQRKSLSQVVSDIDGFMKAEEWQIHRIVRTELHNIYNVGKMNGFGQIKEKYIPDLKKSLVHPMDSRTGEDSLALAKRNPIIDIDKPFKQKHGKQEYIFMAPPNRPNDRAILVPYRNSYDNDKQ